MFSKIYFDCTFFSSEKRVNFESFFNERDKIKIKYHVNCSAYYLDLSNFKTWFPIIEKYINDIDLVYFSVPFKESDLGNPILQFMGFDIIRNKNPIILQLVELFADNKNERNKVNYLNFQSILIENGFFDEAQIDPTYITYLDKLYQMNEKFMY